MSMNVDAMLQKITDVLKTETVIGEPMMVGEVTLIPVMTATFGFGAGSGDAGMDDKNKGEGAGGGGGARLSVSGMVVVRDDEVTFLSANKSSGTGAAVERLLDTLPQLVDKWMSKSKDATDHQHDGSADKKPSTGEA